MAINEQTQSVLVVDDSEDVHQLIRVRLRSEDVTLYSAHDAAEGLELACEHRPDLILLDLDMPGTDGLALCRQLKDDPELVHIPVIFLTGTTDVVVKVQAFELGAVDYVTKPFDAVELKARVRAALRTKRYHDLLSTKAKLDGLTGLWNRGYFNERLAEELSVVQRHGEPVSLLLLDIDHFKAVNDDHGHPFGDLVLRRVARALDEGSRDSDIVCRYGGEEFVIILRHTPSDGAVIIADRLRARIEALQLVSGQTAVPVTASFGVAGSDQFGDAGELNPESILQAADKALYEAKEAGRNRVCLVGA